MFKKIKAPEDSITTRRILILFILITQFCFEQNSSGNSNIIENSIIGHWEIDYKNLRDCDEGKKIKYVKGKESSFD